MRTIRELFGYIRRYPGPFLIGTLMLVVFSLATVQTPRIIGAAVAAFEAGTITLSTPWAFVAGLFRGVTTWEALLANLRAPPSARSGSTSSASWASRSSPR